MPRTEGQVLVSEATLSDIGDAIRSKLGGAATYLPEEMAAAIRSIEGGVGNLQPLEARTNGIYVPEAPVDGYSRVTVAVPTLEAEITEDAVALTGVEVSVNEQAVVIANRRLVTVTKNITENGEYDPADDGADAYSYVTVNVPGPELGAKTITANGTYRAADDELDGYSEVTVHAGLGFEALASKNIYFPLGLATAVLPLDMFTWTATAAEAPEAGT